MLNSISKFLEKNFSLDLRALGLMRMGVAMVLMLDLVIRSNSLTAFYTDDGLLPLSTLYKSNWNPSFFSVYAMSTGWKFIAFLFFLNFIFVFLLFVGYKTRLMTILCWIFIVSLHNRNPLILQGGDELLRLTLFWAIFLPWGARYSVDSISNPSSEKSFFGVAVLGYLMLQFSLYFFSALMKTSPEWRTEGSALYFALNIDQMAWPVGKWLLGFPGLLKFLSLSTFYIELISPFLLLIPFKSNFFRMIFFILICSLHLCIASVLYVGLFYLIGVVTVIGLLSGSAMDNMEVRFKSFRRFAFLMFNGFNRLFNSLISFQLKIKINLPAFLSYQFKLFKNGFLYFVICFNLLWCIGNLPGANFRVNQNFHWFAYMFRLDQDWGMFAPEVFKEDGWYIYEAELEKNSKDSIGKILIDINRDGKIVDYKKPENIIALFQDDRWRKFGEVWPREPDKVKKEFCRYLKNKWNSNNPDRRIATLNIVYMKEITKKNYIPSTPERTVVCDCENWN